MAPTVLPNVFYLKYFERVTWCSLEYPNWSNTGRVAAFFWFSDTLVGKACLKITA